MLKQLKKLIAAYWKAVREPLTEEQENDRRNHSM
jgi:hypothetical protein